MFALATLQPPLSLINLLFITFVQSVAIKGSILLPEETKPHEYPQAVLIDGLTEHFVQFTGSALHFSFDLPSGTSPI